MVDYQPLLAGSRPHARSSFSAFVLRGTRKPTRLLVGRVHYSLGSTLSAHFRWGFDASDYFTLLPSTGVLGSGPDYRDARLDRSIRHLTYPYRDSSGGGSTPRSLGARGVVGVLLCRGRVGPAEPVEADQRELDVVRLRRNFEGSPSNQDATLEMARRCQTSQLLDDLQVGRLKVCSIGGRPLLVGEVQGERPLYRPLRARDPSAMARRHLTE